VPLFIDTLTLVPRDLQRREPAGINPAFDPELLRARFPQLISRRMIRLLDTLQIVNAKALEVINNVSTQLGQTVCSCR
jgi:hypothetical protein